MEYGGITTLIKEVAIPNGADLQQLVYSRQPFIFEVDEWNKFLELEENTATNYSVSNANITAGLPQNLFSSNKVQNLSLLSSIFSSTDLIPNLGVGTGVRTISYNDSIMNAVNTVNGLPTSWSNAIYLNTINLQRCRLSTNQVNQIGLSIEARILAGMMSFYTTGTYQINFNGTGTGANGTLTQSLFTAQGWTAGAGFVQKVIQGKTIRINHN